MSAPSDRLAARREASALPERERPGVIVATEPERERPLLWSRVMQEARGRALLLARRAFPWRYY
jgi:hypothetical protein